MRAISFYVLCVLHSTFMLTINRYRNLTFLTQWGSSVLEVIARLTVDSSPFPHLFLISHIDVLSSFIILLFYFIIIILFYCLLHFTLHQITNLLMSKGIHFYCRLDCCEHLVPSYLNLLLKNVYITFFFECWRCEELTVYLLVCKNITDVIFTSLGNG